MIIIQQDKPKLRQLLELFKQKNCYLAEFNIDTDLINEDINNLEIKLSKTKNDNNIDNILHILDYLEKILYKLDGNVFGHSVELETKKEREERLSKNKKYKKGKVDAEDIRLEYYVNEYKLEAKNFHDYDIYFRDYIKTEENESVVSIGYKELSNAIALELMYRDIGETHESVEIKLDNYGIVGIYDIKNLILAVNRHINNGNIYELAGHTKIIESPYTRANVGAITDYFNINELEINKKTRGTTYKEVVEISVKHAMLLAFMGIQEKLTSEQINFKLSSLTNFEIDLVVENNIDKDIVKILDIPLVVRVFGRKFEIRPTIRVY